jgi:hypothetical protein
MPALSIAAFTSAFLADLLKIPRVARAAFSNALLIAGLPAPVALLSLAKIVRCFFAEVAIIIRPPGWKTCPGGNADSATLAHFAVPIDGSTKAYIYKKSVY